jgi:hypothetical protein
MKTLTNPRPKHNDDAIIRIAAEKLLPDVMGWLGDAGIPENEVLDDLTKAMRWGSDGYQIAKEMDSYEPDAVLVEILDAAGHLKSSAREKACAEWVIENGLEGPEIGAKVTSARRPNDGVGTVTKNWPDGRATVAFHAAGHVTEGIGCHGFIIEWEDLILG